MIENALVEQELGASAPDRSYADTSENLQATAASLSVVLFVLALRKIGAARTRAYFSTAPFVGTVIGLITLHEPLTFELAGAGLLVAIGFTSPSNAPVAAMRSTHGGFPRFQFRHAHPARMQWPPQIMYRSLWSKDHAI